MEKTQYFHVINNGHPFYFKRT